MEGGREGEVEEERKGREGEVRDISLRNIIRNMLGTKSEHQCTGAPAQPHTQTLFTWSNNNSKN
jgi:hypothetical protein